MRLPILAAMLCALAVPSAAEAQDQGYLPVRSAEPLRDRTAWLLSVFEASPGARTRFVRDPALSALGTRLRASRATLLAECEAADPSRCPVERLMLSDAEIDAVAAALARLAVSDPTVRALVRDHLRPSGRYQRAAGLDDAGLIAAAWRDTAAALNRIYRLYALGEKPAYPAIDSLDRDAKDPRFQNRLGEALVLGAEAADSGLFFTPWSRMAIDLLILAQRDEAARYEPLDTGLNGPANARARRLAWRNYRYTAILVPGNGLEAGERGVSPVAVLRLRLAATRWRSGLAPLIIVSGGHVHPNRTPHAEAVEMRRVLVEQLGVPADAVLVDPYARHTTTNLRNAVRLLFRAGAPMDRPFLVTSSAWQVSYVMDAGKDGLIERSRRELGFVPYRVIEKVSAVDTALLPELIALQLDPDEPLDP